MLDSLIVMHMNSEDAGKTRWFSGSGISNAGFACHVSAADTAAATGFVARDALSLYIPPLSSGHHKTRKGSRI